MGSPSPNRLGLRALQVLVVEDAADAREALVELVKTFGAEAWGAEDGEEAFRAVLDRPPDLILCDLQMPGLDGFGFVRRLRRHPRFQRILTVAVSGLGESLDIALSREAGFDGHIVKPITVETIVRLLGRALDVHDDSSPGA